MAELAKRRESRVIPTLFLAYFPEDKSICICEKSKVLDETPLRHFLANPVWPKDHESAVKVMVPFYDSKTKTRRNCEGFVIAVHDERDELAKIWLEFEHGENNQHFFNQSTLRSEEIVAPNDETSENQTAKKSDEQVVKSKQKKRKLVQEKKKILAKTTNNSKRKKVAVQKEEATTVACAAGVDHYRSFEKAMLEDPHSEACKACKQSALIAKSMQEEVKELRGFCQSLLKDMNFLRKDVKEIIHLLNSSDKATAVNESPAPVPSTRSFDKSLTYSIDLDIANSSPRKVPSLPVASSTPNRQLKQPTQPQTTPTTPNHQHAQSHPQLQPQLQHNQQIQPRPIFISPDRQLRFPVLPQPFLQHQHNFLAASNSMIPLYTYLDQRTVETTFNSSSGITNFAQRLMRHTFSLQERKGKSVYGTKRSSKDGFIMKEGLDNDRLNFIKEKVFSMYTIPREKQQTVWASCVETMNEYLRRKKLNKSDIF